LVVALDHQNRGSRGVFEVPTLRLTGMISDEEMSSMNAGASRWVAKLGSTPDSPEAILLKEQGNPAPLLRIVLDIGGSAVNFSPDGTQVVWGSKNGMVTVCDLIEVQTRLARVGLGW